MAWESRGHVILSFASEDVEAEDWIEGEGRLSPLIPVRADLMRGDLRALYLGWLLCVQTRELDDEDVEPPVPPGLGQLIACLDEFADFLRIDGDLLEVAAEASEIVGDEPLSRDEVHAWVAGLPTGEKDDIVTGLLVDEDLTLATELLHRFLRQRSADGRGPQTPAARRTVRELLEAAEARTEERRQAEAKKRAEEAERRQRQAEVARAAYLDKIAGQQSKLWAQIEGLIATKQACDDPVVIQVGLNLPPSEGWTSEPREPIIADPMDCRNKTKGATRTMRDLRIPRMWLLVLMLSGSCLAAELFSNEDHRQAFLRALAREDGKYDPAQQMLRAEFSSPGYHTTLEGGTVHRTRESLCYAVALLDSGEPERLKRAEEVLRRVIALQDQDPNSRTYGIWPWFLEEPLNKMSPPDWNWADFCGTQLLQVAIDHLDRLPGDLQQKVKDSILHAAHSIQRRNVGPGYTNIALMGAYVTLVAGERLDVRELRDYGRERLRRFRDYTQEKGSFSEYNSPTYTCVAIEEISRMRRHVRDEESRELLGWLNNFAWRHVARRFHEPTRQWAGPHSRCYSTLLRPDTLAFIQRGAGEEARFLPEAEVWESLNARCTDLQCPPDLLAGFRTLLSPRWEIETFIRSDRDEHDIIGTTYLHPDFTLGSVNIGDLWNQRRPVIAYWQAPAGPAAMRLRCLHDDYDYASASIFTIQDRADVFGAILFATDRGDTHISLDKIANATIRARDLRLRLQFEGALDDLAFSDKPALDESIRFASGPIEGVFRIQAVQFADLPVRIEVGREAGEAWIDLVLYHGPQRPFDFRGIAEAAIVFTLSIGPKGSLTRHDASSAYGSVASELAGVDSPRQAWSFQRSNEQTLSLTIPTKPLPTAQQNAACWARTSGVDLWKSSH